MIDRPLSLKDILCPAAQIEELLVALGAQHPVHRDLDEADRPTDACKRPIVVHVGRLVRDALELEADLAEVEGELIESVLKARPLVSFRDGV